MTRQQQQAYKAQYQAKLNEFRTPGERSRHAAGEFIVQRGTISVAELATQHQVSVENLYQAIANLK